MKHTIVILLLLLPTMAIASGRTFGTQAQLALESEWRTLDQERRSAGLNQFRAATRERALSSFGKRIPPGALLDGWVGTLESLELIGEAQQRERFGIAAPRPNLLGGSVLLTDESSRTPHSILFFVDADTSRPQLAVELDDVRAGEFVAISGEVLQASLSDPAPQKPERPRLPLATEESFLGGILRALAVHFQARPPREQDPLSEAEPTDANALTIVVRPSSIRNVLPATENVRRAARQLTEAIPPMRDRALATVSEQDVEAALHETPQSYRSADCTSPDCSRAEARHRLCSASVSDVDSLATILRGIEEAAARPARLDAHGLWARVDSVARALRAVERRIERREIRLEPAVIAAADARPERAAAQASRVTRGDR